MKYALIAIAALAFSCVPASALTNVSACGSLSGDTQFILTANLTASTSDCLTVSGISGTSIDLNCDGHSITDTGSTGIHLIYVTGNNAVVSFHDCTLNSITSVYGTSAPASVFIDSNVGNNPNNNWGPSTWSYSNTFNGGKLYVLNTPYFTSIYDRFRHSWAFINQSDHALVQNGGVDNSGLNGSYGNYPAGFYFILSDYPRIESSYVIGNAGTYASGNGNVDDGILFGCQIGTAPTRTCIGAWAESNTSIDVWDDGVELTGQWSYPVVLWENDTRPGIAGIGCYGIWACSVDHGYFGGNTVTTGNTGVALMNFTAPLNVTTGTWFTDNTIEYNYISNSNSTYSYLGISGTPWGTQSGNVVQYNVFGSSAIVQVAGSGSGFSDGGGNYCSSSTSVIVCH